MQKKILVLVAGESNIPIIKAAKELGHYVITCDNNINNPGHRIADENILVDVYDYDTIIEKIKDKNIDHVISFVSSHGLKSAAIISEYFNLNGYSKNSIMTLTNKGLFRSFLKKYNLNSPWFKCINNLDQLIFEKLNYPLIIKPSDSGGSKGVKKINNRKDLIESFNDALTQSIEGNVIIEQFLEGESLVNGDCLIKDEKVIAHIIGDYLYDNEVNNVLPVATIFPSKIDTQSLIDQIDTISSLLSIPNGIINFEAIYRDGKFYIIEINPRPSGNYIWKLLGYKYNIDIASLLINLYLNKNVEIDKLKESTKVGHAYQLVYSSKNSSFKGFSVPIEFEHCIKEYRFFKEVGDPIHTFDNLYNRIGIMLFEYQTLKDKKQHIDNYKLFRI